MRAFHAGSILPRVRSVSAAATPAAKLQMTSLVDMMVILVVFLLKSFSVEGQLATPQSGLQLPISISQDSLPSGLVVEVGIQEIRISGRYVMASAALVAADSTAVAPLTKVLVSAKTDGNQNVLVQSDRRVEFKSLVEVLRACANAGWEDVSLVVEGSDS